MIMELKKGATLTVHADIFDLGGWIIFTKDQKVKIEEVIKEPGRWSRHFGVYIPEKITGFKIKGHYGIWFPNTFIETMDLK